MKRNRNIGSILLITAGLLLIAAALYELIPALLAYKRADDTYEALREAYVTGQPGTSSDDPAEEGEELPAWYEALQVDFETLKEANPDVIGWIYFDNIEQINYPILYTGMTRPTCIPISTEMRRNPAAFLWRGTTSPILTTATRFCTGTT